MKLAFTTAVALFTVGQAVELPTQTQEDPLNLAQSYYNSFDYSYPAY